MKVGRWHGPRRFVSFLIGALVFVGPAAAPGPVAASGAFARSVAPALDRTTPVHAVQAPAASTSNASHGPLERPTPATRLTAPPAQVFVAPSKPAAWSTQVPALSPAVSPP